MPEASKPRIFGVFSTRSFGARRLVSTGFTETAFTPTSRSRPEGDGVPISRSSSDSGWSIGRYLYRPTAFILAPMLPRRRQLLALLAVRERVDTDLEGDEGEHCRDGA